MSFYLLLQQLRLQIAIFHSLLLIPDMQEQYYAETQPFEPSPLPMHFFKEGSLKLKL